MDILSLIPTSWRIALAAGALIALALVGGLAAWKGYNAGYDKAQALGRAEIAGLRSEHDRAYAQAVEELNRTIQEQARHALAAGNALANERVNNAKEQAGLRARIASITATSSHAFSADFVRVWNEATGAGRGRAMPGTDNSPGVDGTPGTGKTAGAGVLARRAVSEADVLAYIIYYGERCKNLEAQVNAWIDLFPKGGSRNESR